jgi:hypothetical protein
MTNPKQQKKIEDANYRMIQKPDTRRNKYGKQVLEILYNTQMSH